MYMPTQTAFSQVERVVLADETMVRQAWTRTGLIAGTMVETAAGWHPVEDLSVGDSVATYDGGLQVVRAISHGFWEPQSVAAQTEGLLHVPGGALDNCASLYLSDVQLVMIESPEAEKLLGEPAVLVPAAALVGFRGVERVFREDRVEMINLRFDDEELVYANTGTLIHCPSGAQSDYFTRLSVSRARALLSLMDRDLAFLTRLTDVSLAA